MRMETNLWFEVLQWVMPIMLGGGFGWLFFYRLKKKQLVNQVENEQHKQYGEVLDDFRDQLTKVHLQLADVMDTNSSLMAERNRARADLESYRSNCTCQNS